MKTRILGIFLLMTVLLAACAAQSTPPAATQAAPGGASGSEVMIDIANFAFNPATVTIKVGDTVTWTNNDGTLHTVVADDGTWKSGNLNQGDTFSQTFDTAGTFTYKCGVHPDMKGTIIVQ